MIIEYMGYHFDGELYSKHNLDLFLKEYDSFYIVVYPDNKRAAIVDVGAVKFGEVLRLGSFHFGRVVIVEIDHANKTCWVEKYNG